jgi:hypothetical protein
MVERKFIVSKACVAEKTVQELLNKGFRIEQIKMCGKTTGDTTIAVYLVKDSEDDDEPKTCKTCGGSCKKNVIGPPPPPPVDGM